MKIISIGKKGEGLCCSAGMYYSRDEEPVGSQPFFVADGIFYKITGLIKKLTFALLAGPIF